MKKQIWTLALFAVAASAGCDRGSTESPAPVPRAAAASVPVPLPSSPQTASAVVAPGPAPADDKPLTLVLETKNYLITVVDDRQEGDVTSDTVKYHCVSKKSGHHITLTGSTYHHTCPDGSPGQFYGYIFKNGDTTYVVWERGEVQVTRGDKTLVDEKGKWIGDPA